MVTQCRRLVRDFEVLQEVTQSWVYLASIRLMLRRLEPSQTCTEQSCMNSSLTSSSAALFPQAEVLGLTGETQRESSQNEHAHVQENRHNQLQVHNIHQHFHD